MPAPATVNELLDLIQKSQVADEAKVKAYMKKHADAGTIPVEPMKLGQMLVRDGLLTFFQAEQILQGKWKRFSIGKYKVLEKLGSGGMGQVFLCEHKLMRRRVAVKVLPTAKADDDASLQRFYREARAVAAVDHPNLVRAYDIDQDDNLHFLVMEYVDGTNLQDLVKKFGPVDPVRACHYMCAASVGLQHAHEMGLVHRDIKPGNILLDRGGVVKILDMGLARFFNDSDDQLTKMHDENILGTADYLSPEQAEDSHTVDIRSDIYSLGATFYFLLTGNQPFPEGSIPQKLIWHKSRDPKPIQAIRPGVPDDVVAVVSKMMAKKPEDRYQVPAELIAALQPFVTAPIPPPPEREMPQLSPAVASGNTTRGPASMTNLAPWNAPATVTGSGPMTAVNPPGPAAVPTPAPGTHGVWESIDADIETVARADTARSGPASGKNRPAPTRQRGRLSPILLVVGALAFVGAAAAGAYFAFFNKKPEVVENPGTTPGARRILVSKSPGENAYTTLADAVRKASAGDTIAIAVDHLTEPVLRLTQRKDLTIESALPDGKVPVIELSASASGNFVLDLSGCDNVRVRNVEFDAGGRTDYAVQVTGNSPGVVLENVTVRGAKRAGIHIYNAAGEPGRPILLDKVRVLSGPASEAGVLVLAAMRLETRRVTIQGGRIEGQGKGAGVKFDGAMADVEATGNRVFNVEAGFVFARVPEGYSGKAKVTQNTVYQASAGLDFPMGEIKGPFELHISRNYFGRVNEVGRGGLPAMPNMPPPPIPGVNATENGFDQRSNPGPVPLSATKIEGLPELPAADDSNFLRFPTAGPQPMVGAARVGAN